MNISNIVLFSFAVLSSFCFKEAVNCDLVKTGKFKLIDNEYGTTNITRTENQQLEENKKFNAKVRYTLEWSDECTYKLFSPEVFRGDSIFKLKNSDTIYVRIIKVESNKCFVRSWSNFNKANVTDELIIVDEF